MKLVLAGPGAFGMKHLEVLSRIEGCEVVSIVGPNAEEAKQVARKFNVPYTDVNLGHALGRSGVEGAVLATPTPLHASQAITCLRAEKHVSVEIPAADNWDDFLELANVQRETGLVCMVGHTRRYNPSHQWVHQKTAAGEFNLRHMDVQTFFFRRTNTNALGKARDWTDHLLWHHAAHSIDLFLWQTGEDIEEANILQGAIDPQLGIALDMSIQMRAASGALLTLALSFNNDGPFGTTFRYIGDTGTYLARNDDLATGHGEAVDLSDVDVSLDGIELQDRDFVSAIENGSEPRASIANVQAAYAVLNRLDQKLTGAVQVQG